jgi:lipoate-protein ligase A
MLHLDLTLPTPAENVALDEALVDWCEEERPDEEVLRIWESDRPMVVVGRSSRVGQEVDDAACRELEIPIIRRSSGGAAIVAGPGCLMYALVLSYDLRPELKDISRAHCVVLEQLTAAMRPLVAGGSTVERRGTSDAVLIHGAAAPRKFSGNSLRAKRRHFLYHGTLLYDFELALVERCLRTPPRQPQYRAARAHREFITNIDLSREQLVGALAAAWPAAGELTEIPHARVERLVRERFSRDEWNYERR